MPCYGENRLAMTFVRSKIIIKDEMQKVLQRISSFFIKPNPPRKRKGRKTRAQSLVEVAIAFPLLLMLFSGMVEFGFMLNTYLSLLDATRQTARYLANSNPFTYIDENVTPAVIEDDPAFYDSGIQNDRRDS